MRGRRGRDPVLDVVADFVLAGQIKQQRVMRVLGDAPRWDVNLPEGWWRIGDVQGRLDVVGTVGSDGTWLWSWANESFTAYLTLTAQILLRVGIDWGIDTLTADEPLPDDRIDGHLAGMIACGLGGADGYYVGHHDAGATVFLLRHRVLRAEPCTALDVIPVVNMLVAGELPVEPRAALEGLAGDPPEGFAVDLTDRGAVIEAPGGRVLVELDRRGRATRAVIDADPSMQGVPAEEPLPEALVDIGTLTLPAGPVVVYDPLVAPTPMYAQPRPILLPAGAHRVVVELEDFEGDARVGTASVVLGPGEPVAWQPAGRVSCDSGVIAFAAPDAAAALPEVALEPRGDTWQSGAADGLVACSMGSGADVYEVLLGFDAGDELVRLAVDAGNQGDPWPRGLQRAPLMPLAAGGDLSDENAVPLPLAAHARLSAAHRDMLAAALAHEGGDLDAEVIPEYEDDSPVPARIVIRVEGRPDAVVDV